MNSILITAFLFKIQQELCGLFTVFIPIAFWSNPKTFSYMIIYRIKFFVYIWYDWMLSSVFKLFSSSFSLFSNNVLFSFHSFANCFWIFNGKFSNFVFQNFPLSLGIRNKILVTVKGLDKAFGFSNIFLVWIQKAFEFPDTVTMDRIFVFWNRNSNWRVISW